MDATTDGRHSQHGCSDARSDNHFSRLPNRDTPLAPEERICLERTPIMAMMFPAAMNDGTMSSDAFDDPVLRGLAQHGADRAPAAMCDPKTCPQA